MKDKCKDFLLGVLVTVLVISLGVPALAAAVRQRTATLTYRDIKVTLDGKQITPRDVNGTAIEPFLINGTTYLPVRGISSALGLGVDWDNATSTVLLTSDGRQSETAAFFRQAGDRVWTHHSLQDDTTYDTVLTFRQDGQFYGMLHVPNSGETYRFQGDYAVKNHVLTMTYQWDFNPGQTITDTYRTSFVGSAMSMDLLQGDGILPEGETYPAAYAAGSTAFTPTSLQQAVLDHWGIPPL